MKALRKPKVRQTPKKEEAKKEESVEPVYDEKSEN